ncbi:hypothetical protein Naga_101834g1 [Nannochloropsis gaditana]|uniref:Uncharacterized protein n=1 Tax=Nannochloropsis gaditana TaxID=72520 RepID=W7T173_9STRA|nr:hypothetical protein Naga_101834g1 [Nannochloropsis gaditana]
MDVSSADDYLLETVDCIVDIFIACGITNEGQRCLRSRVELRVFLEENKGFILPAVLKGKGEGGFRRLCMKEFLAVGREGGSEGRREGGREGAPPPSGTFSSLLLLFLTPVAPR